MKKILNRILEPVKQKNWIMEIIIAIPRILCGFFLTNNFGGSKFGMPWTDPEKGLGLFQVIDWFPKDVAEFGGLFAAFPLLFAWLGAASEAIGGFFWVIGLGTRVASFFIFCTMLVAIFFQKWGDGLWGMLPAMGFLWVSMYLLSVGSGRLGLDYLISKKITK